MISFCRVSLSNQSWWTNLMSFSNKRVRLNQWIRKVGGLGTSVWARPYMKCHEKSVLICMEKSVLMAKHQGHSDCWPQAKKVTRRKLQSGRAGAWSQTLAPGSASPLVASAKTSKALSPKWLMQYVVIWTRHRLEVRYTGVKLSTYQHVILGKPLMSLTFITDKMKTLIILTFRLVMK